METVTVGGSLQRVPRRRPARREQPVVVALPGEKQADPRLLDRVVGDLNRMYTQKGLETAQLIGEYLLGTFFAGEPEHFHRRGGRHVAFRELAQRADLQMSSSFLWSCVAVVEQLRLLPAEVSRSLPLSHHKLLLPVRDPRLKLELAAQAARGALSKRELALRIRQRRPRVETGHRGPGRPPHPPLLRALNQLRRAVSAVAGEWLGEDDRLAPGQALALVDEIEENLGQLAEALGEARRRIQQRARG